MIKISSMGIGETAGPSTSTAAMRSITSISNSSGSNNNSNSSTNININRPVIQHFPNSITAENGLDFRQPSHQNANNPGAR